MCKVIGIDVSKLTFDVAFQKKDEKFSFFKYSNDAKGFTKFMKIIDKEDLCVMEATGPYYLFLARFLFKQGVKVSVVNPLQIKHFVRMRMVKAKTDKKDALMIALYGQSEQPVLWQPDEPVIMQVQQIHSAIEGLQKQATMLHNQLEAFSRFPDCDKKVMRELRALLKTIKLKIAKLEAGILEKIKIHYANTFNALTSIPGIGPKTAAILIAITNNFQKFDNAKRLSSYVGLVPRIFSSGTSINGKGHITKMGNRYIRKLLYLCSWSAKKHNSQCIALYDRLSEKGKPERVIKIAIANKLLRQAYAIGTKLNKYEENYEKIFAF
ncbi:IS110 family transposase [Candidatus Sulfidibacterium hydrothermale]|uniref:IS110 family transposase n=1 Tax=Candidatus Sulfidibacterium hydrothermale TaxID=2875962 RepID=UPI001F0B52A7|nr:IS110 family transposase [Candidatus Sulfidibacterium hydrothermale]UBM62245.1 IS110 family transposase [Candidatus Sulfidibacterium hydrothermale]UBM62691.1 IS110 family transposase [Candidatus Sulfidibacterium hydrothermale]UBM63020.1 IS110 family transposase [Candidatus Sulfidibacterium hydrothermale]UBM63300.1 IS110 family transposase [Candidatus Sulfidibacterium hydrothermale]UBM63536.1 IS110 family transposase [Candidatus Sulfidibacterium hydrothermale]